MDMSMELNDAWSTLFEETSNFFKPYMSLVCLKQNQRTLKRLSIEKTEGI